MKKTASIPLFFFLCLFLSVSSVQGTTLLGPQKFVRVLGGTTLFSKTFSSTAGPARLFIQNGEVIGEKRVDNVVSSARVILNNEEIFAPNDFNKNVYILETQVNLIDGNNQLNVELNGQPGTYITLQITRPGVSVQAVPDIIQLGGSSVLSWSSTDAVSCTIAPGIGNVATSGSITLSPAESTTYTVTATDSQGLTATASQIITVNHPPEAVSAAVTTSEDTTADIVLAGHDPDNDPLTYQILIPPDHGNLHGTPPAISYVPFANFNGPDSFSFKVNDGTTDSDPAIVSITVTPVNDVPVAEAGPDQTVFRTDTVILNGNSSTDIDNGPLIYHWSFVSIPAGSNAVISSPSLVSPSFVADTVGVYTIQLIVNDGLVNSVSDSLTVIAEARMITVPDLAGLAQADAKTTLTTAGLTIGAIYTENSNTVAVGRVISQNPDSGIIVEEYTPVSLVVSLGPLLPSVSLEATPTSIILGGSSALSWFSSNADSVVIEPGIGQVTSSGLISVSPTATTNYTITATGPGGTTVASVEITVIYLQPTASISANPTSITLGGSSTLAWSSTNSSTVTISPGIGSVAASGSMSVSPAATTTYTITATGPGGVATSDVTVIVNNHPASTVTIDPVSASIEQGDSITLSWTSNNAQNAFISSIGVVPLNGSIAVSPENSTTYTITVSGTNGSASAQSTILVLGNPDPLPDGSFGISYDDLIPPDATVSSYDPDRFSLITGLVNNFEEMSISGVAVTIHSHPEYGTVFTDGEGRFSIPVEGGGHLTLQYLKEGLITAHRKIHVPLNDIVIAETIQMIGQDPVSTTLTFDGNPGTVITHQSTQVTDEFGNRSATVVFTGDNVAYAVDENGNDIQQLTAITIRATEFTTEDSMPAILPPNSAYTYCVELAIDGIQRVRFDKPVITWVDNFLGFDVGEPVPVGYYDRDRGVWVPADNGVVVRLLDTNNDGLVDTLDADGDALPDDLDGNGALSNEVNGLDDPLRYVPDSTFWRVKVTHFSPWDFNWPFGPPPDAIPPNQEDSPNNDQQADILTFCQVGDGKEISSYVEERSRIFHEDISIPGTDITLHYASNRIENYKSVITIPASGETVPASLKQIIFKANIAGREFEQILEPLPNQVAELSWDRLDYLGRPVNSPITANFNIGFEYDLVYYSANESFNQSFAQAGDIRTDIPSRQSTITWKRSTLILDPAKGIGTVGEGWTFSNQHRIYPVNPSVIYKGNGSKTISNSYIITTVAGGGSNYNTHNIVATEGAFLKPEGLVFDAMGNFYFSDNHRMFKVDTNGIVTWLYQEPHWNTIHGIDIDAEGNIYIADTPGDRVGKLDTNGVYTIIAGGGSDYKNIGDGGPAIGAYIHRPRGVAVDATGNIYIAEYYYNRIRKVDPNGIITTIVGGNSRPGDSGDGGPAIEASLAYPSSLEIDSIGNLYIVDGGNNRVRMVDTSGVITTVAGNGTAGYNGDGGPATEASIYPYWTAVDSVGNLYITSASNNTVRKVDINGIITTIAGTGLDGYNGDGIPPTEAYLSSPTGIDVSPDGSIYFVDQRNYRVRKIEKTKFNILESGELFSAEENGLGYIFYEMGLHKKTVDLETGVVLREFGYDPDNNLISITDRFGNQTVIERDGDGTPIAIVSPDGLRTQLSINASNHLTGITYPDGSSYGFAYTSGGLMTAELEPNGNRFEHYFDANGRLTDVYDQEGGHWNYNRTVLENGDVKVNSLTAEGNLITYLDHTDPSVAFTTTITDPTGAQTIFSQSADSLTANKSLPCGMDINYQYGLDSEYKYKFTKELTETTPQGLTRVTQRDQTYQDTDADEVPDIITRTGTVNGKTTYLVNNVSQSQRTFTSPVGRTITAYYDPASLLTTSVSTPGLFGTTYGYDLEGRLTSINTNTRSTSFAYNTKGFLDHVTDPKNYTTYYGYDAVGRVTSMSRPDNSAIGFTYDLNGNMTVLTNPLTIDHGFGYNAVNRNTIYQTPLSGSYSYVYDRDRRLVRTNFPSGRQINNIYDTTQLAQVQTPEGNINYSYLCSSKVDTISKGTEYISYGYDGSLVISETFGGVLNKSLVYDYNNDFNLTGLTYAGSATGYAYDNDGLLTGAGAFAITRDAGNGLPVSVSDNALSLNRAFNGYAEIEAEDFTVSGHIGSSWSVTRDNAGRITSKTEIVAGVTSSYAYTYDPLGRLLTVAQNGSLVEEYSYDLNGGRTYEINFQRNIAGRSFYYSDEDHLLAVGDTSYQYDLDGFLTTKTQGTDVTTYDYSSRGELLSVNLSDGRLIEYVHDPLGRRIAKKINGATVEKYLWAGLTQLLAVYDGADNLLMRFEYADARIPMAVTSGGAIYYLAYDQVGSLRVVADSSGNIVKSIEYDSFGNVIADSNPLFEMPFGFAGGLQDKDTGLVRFGVRDYDPDVGRWTTKDPILFAGGDTDLYGYVQNNPIMFVDPLGLAVGDWWDLPANFTRAYEISVEERANRPTAHNTSEDAMRHAEWNRRMVEETNSFTAWISGVGHEVDNFINDQPWSEGMMDLYNNAVGRAAGRAGVPVDPSKLQVSPNNSPSLNSYPGGGCQN